MTRLGIIAALALVVSVAHAQTNDDAIAKLKEQGDAQMHELHFREALERYDAAVELGGGASIQYNRARALQGLGEYPRALDALEEFVRTASPELRARVPQLDELIADLRGHVATLSIATNAPHATVRFGHEIVGTTPINVPVRVSVGRLVVEADAEGYKPYAREMTFSSGESKVDLVLEKAETRVAVPVVVRAPEHPSALRPIAIGVGAAGLGGLALGAVFGGLAVAKRSELDTLCPGRACDASGAGARTDAWTFATLSTVGFVAGTALLAGGVVLWLVAPRATKQTALVPAIGPGAIGLSGTF